MPAYALQATSRFCEGSRVSFQKKGNTQMKIVMNILVLTASLFAATLARTEPIWRIDETVNNDIASDPRIYFTVTNHHPTDSITAFVVGFDATGPADYRVNAAGWRGTTLDAAGWTLPGGGGNWMGMSELTAEQFFGWTWAEFQAFDPSHDTEFAAIFNFFTPEGNTDWLAAGAANVGGTTEFSDPFWAAATNSPASPVGVKMSSGLSFGGTTGADNLFNIPVPTPLALLGLGLAGFGWSRRRT
jgi:hypothetical protein